MAKTKEQKKEILAGLVDKVSRAKALVFVNFDGLKVKEIEEFRKKCREEHLDYVVAKKTLAGLAFKQAKIDVNPKTIEKGVGFLFGYEDEVAPARIVGQFAKTHEALKPVGGILEHSFIDGRKVLELSALPGRQELLAKMLGSLNAPISGFVGVLNGTLRSLVYAIQAIKDSKNV